MVVFGLWLYLRPLVSIKFREAIFVAILLIFFLATYPDCRNFENWRYVCFA